MAAIRARVVFLTGDAEASLRFIDVALSIAESLRLGRVLVDAMTTKSIALAERGHPAEATALLTHATTLAIEQDLGSHAIRSLYNLAETKMAEARFAEADELLQRALGIAQQRGDARGERWCLTQRMLVQIAIGRWDEALSNSRAILAAQQDDQWAYQALVFTPLVLVARGESARARELLGPLDVDTGWSESAWIAAGARSTIHRDAGHPEVGLEAAIEAAVAAFERVLSHGPVEFGEAVESAFAAGRPDAVEGLLERIDALAPVQLIPLLDAEALRARALLAAHHGNREDATRWFRRAIDLLRELETPFFLARAQLQYAEFLGDRDEAPAVRSEAAALFEQLGAAPWLARARGSAFSEAAA